MIFYEVEGHLYSDMNEAMREARSTTSKILITYRCEYPWSWDSILDRYEYNREQDGESIIDAITDFAAKINVNYLK